ncbi:MAG: DUF2218 domain-containing protein [Pseudomonadota bacterium]
MDATASFKTVNAVRYLSMLSRHFAKKLEVTVRHHTARIVFPFGYCAMSADEQRLHLVATAQNQDDLDKVEEVISSHLDRYAFRENPQLLWKQVSNAPDF